MAVRIATSAEEFIRKNVKAKEIYTFHMNTDTYESLRIRKVLREVDAVVDDSPIAQWFVSSTPGLRLATTIAGTDSQYAIMFRKGNDELREAVNKTLKQIKADGSYDKFYQKWFGEG